MDFDHSKLTINVLTLTSCVPSFIVNGWAPSEYTAVQFILSTLALHIVCEKFVSVLIVKFKASKPL